MMIRSRFSSRNQPFMLALIGVVLSILLVATIGALAFGVGVGIVLAPTPTATATTLQPLDPTPNARATLIAEDVLTQVAYEAGLPQSTPNPILLPLVWALLAPTPTAAGSNPGNKPGSGQTVLVPVVANPAAPSPTPFATSTPTFELPMPVLSTPVPATPTLADINMPLVSLPGSTATPSFSPSPTASPTDAAVEIFTPTPTETFTVTPAPTDTETPSPTPPPTATAGTPPPTPFPYSVASLNARIYSGSPARDTRGFSGPSFNYASVGTFNADTQVDVTGHSASGEWVYLCCLDGRNVWMRQASLRLDNPFPNGAPDGFNPNDVRRLPLRTVEPNLTPAPEATPSPVPPQDFPQQQRLPSNEASLPTLPSALNFAWDSSPAGGNLTSPAVVSGDSVVVASADNHIYSFNRTAGSQQWRRDIDARVNVAPAVRDNLVFVVDERGNVIALRDDGNSASEAWRSSNNGLPPTSGPSFAGDLLLVAGSNGTTHEVATFNSSGQRGFAASLGAAPLLPAFGDQLTYIGHAGVSAYDMRHSVRAWENFALGTITAPPVYSWPGVRAAADLYVAEAGGDVVFLDANAGLVRARHDGNDTVTALAVSDTLVYAVGNNFLYALRRTDAVQAWRVDLPGNPLGAPIVQSGVGDEHVLIATNTNVVQIRSGATGAVLLSANLPSLGYAPAAGDGYVFLPGADNTLRTLR